MHEGKDKSWFENNPKKTILILGIGVFLLIEMCLRFLFVNPYADPYYKYYRPNVNIVNDYSDFYPNGKDILFRTDQFGRILSGKPFVPNKPNAYILGGSTSECAVVQEGQRWSDLLKTFNTFNFAKGGTYITETYYYLKHLSEEGIIEKGATIFIMHAVNDFNQMHMALKHNFNALSIKNLRLNSSTLNENGDSPCMVYVKYIVKKYVFSNLYSLVLLNKLKNALTINSKKGVGETEFEYWTRKAKENYKNVFLNEKEFKLYIEKIKPFLVNRSRVLSET